MVLTFRYFDAFVPFVKFLIKVHGLFDFVVIKILLFYGVIDSLMPNDFQIIKNKKYFFNFIWTLTEILLTP